MMEVISVTGLATGAPRRGIAMTPGFSRDPIA
jgi:hypothetical protein